MEKLKLQFCWLTEDRKAKKYIKLLVLSILVIRLKIKLVHVLEKFSKYCSPRKNFTVLCHKFFMSCCWKDCKAQRLILGLLLFNIGICNLFFIMADCDIANYAVSNSPYLSRKNIEQVLNTVNDVSSNLFQWSSDSKKTGNASIFYW